MNNTIIAYADGGCRGNGKTDRLPVGGWGVVISQGEKAKLMWGWKLDTTNNIMELTSAIRLLESIKNKKRPTIIYMDSAYVVQGINQWIHGWLANGWNKGKVKNMTYWQRLWELKCEMENVSFVQIKGHADNAGNNKADALANKAMTHLELNINNQEGEDFEYVETFSL